MQIPLIMKIAILEPYIEGTGGAQRVIADYANFLESKGHYVEIFTQRVNLSTAYPKFKNLKITLLKPSNKLFSPFVFLFKKFRGFDRVIANDWPTNFASIRNKNVFWVCYSPKRDFYDLNDYIIKSSGLKTKIQLAIKNIFFKFLDQLAAKKMYRILPISKTVLERVKKYYNREGEIFFPGIDFKEYSSKKYKDYFLSVSRLVELKRVETIVRAMKKAKTQNVSLYIVGSGPEKEKIKETAGNDKRIKILGEVSEKKLKYLYSNCLAAIYIPKDEDWGLIPLEAAACKKLTIGINEGGLKETIANNKTGFLIQKPIPDKIAEKMDLVAKNKNLAEKMGQAANEYCKKFDWKNILPKFERIITQK